MTTVKLVPSEDMQMLLSHRELACHDEVVNGALVWRTRDTRLRTKKSPRTQCCRSRAVCVLYPSTIIETDSIGVGVVNLRRMRRWLIAPWMKKSVDSVIISTHIL